MARRTGVPTLMDIAQKMCKFLVAFGPIIRRVYPDSTALHLAMDTAMAACGVLEQELAKVREYGD